MPNEEKYNAFVRFNQADIRRQERKEMLQTFAWFFLFILMGIGAIVAVLSIEQRL